jgi:hypothetical protein
MTRREILGIGLVVVGLGLHFWNARRDVRPASLAEAITVSPDAVDPGLQGRLVAVTGKLVTDQELGDSRFLPPAKWIRLTRVVEMYCWTEQIENGQPMYRYGWTENPQAWREFRHRNAHQNPSMPFWSEDWRQPLSRIGVYGVNPDTAKLPPGERIPLDPKRMIGERAADPSGLAPADLAARMVRLDRPGERLLDDYVYLGPGSLEVPAFGDVRVSFRGIASGQLFTAIGEQRGDELAPHVTDDGRTLWSVAPGERGAASARPASERWGFAGLATLLVLIGLVLCLGRAPLAIVGGLLAQAGAVIAFFLWPVPAALLAAGGLAAAALSRLGSR